MTHSRHGCRHGRPCEPSTLQEALYCAAMHSDRDSASVAEALGVRRGYLLDAVNPDRDELQFQARLLLPLMRGTGNLAPLQYLARQVGCIVVQLPHTDGEAQDVRQRFMTTAKELGDVAAEIERALSGDNVIDAAEFERIDRQFGEFMEAGAQLRHALQQSRGRR